ncbi:hypothetical protein ACI48J_00095 [Paenibacillus chitinolyticus]|uniref:hypothetical protein n=1 Tax=Paenibacillus chitinolyticus TaxID=79263 RepID=UPI003867319D
MELLLPECTWRHGGRNPGLLHEVKPFLVEFLRLVEHHGMPAALEVHESGLRNTRRVSSASSGSQILSFYS